LSTASCWHVSQVAEIDRTPFSRMLASVIGWMMEPSRSRARRCTGCDEGQALDAAFGKIVPPKLPPKEAAKS
jgi:hypothetical protein